MKAMEHIRSLADTNSKSTARRMVLKENAANPPAQYKVGCEVLVRRFSAKSKKKQGKGLTRKLSRVVKGTVTHAKASRNQYKVRYQLNGKFEEKWFSVSDITSLTREDENKRQMTCTFFNSPLLISYQLFIIKFILVMYNSFNQSD